jgi:hypothetical protein
LNFNCKEGQNKKMWNWDLNHSYLPF